MSNETGTSGVRVVRDLYVRHIGRVEGEPRSKAFCGRWIAGQTPEIRASKAGRWATKERPATCKRCLRVFALVLQLADEGASDDKT